MYITQWYCFIFLLVKDVEAFRERTNVHKPCGVAQKRLHLKPVEKTIHKVRRPLLKETNSILYDEHWAAKQERGMHIIMVK